MTRSQRYAEVNSILRALYLRRETEVERSMRAAELDRFEVFCPDFDRLSDDWTTDFGPNRVDAIRRWIAQDQQP